MPSWETRSRKSGLNSESRIKTSIRYGKQASDERLYTERKEGGRQLKSFKDVYKETRIKVACYLAIGNIINGKESLE